MRCTVLRSALQPGCVCASIRCRNGYPSRVRVSMPLALAPVCMYVLHLSWWMACLYIQSRPQRGGRYPDLERNMHCRTHYCDHWRRRKTQSARWRFPAADGAVRVRITVRQWDSSGEIECTCIIYSYECMCLNILHMLVLDVDIRFNYRWVMSGRHDKTVYQH